jgi:GDPmannose 4,6-dehydratase
MVKNYREGYGMFACNGILFNHESPRRGETFVTKKITRALARIKLGLQDRLYLGNLEAKRDWGYAPDYVKAMWLMLQQDNPEDYVIATGETHSVREFIDLAFHYAGIELEWVGKGLDEKGVIRSLASNLQPPSSNNIGSSTLSSSSTYDVSPSTSSLTSTLQPGKVVVEIDPRYFRPLEVESLQGDASKARKKLKWEPKIKFNDLVRIMVDADIKELEELKRCQDVIRKLSNNKTVGD